MFSATIMVLVAFAALSGNAAATGVEIQSEPEPTGPVYGPGWAITPLVDGRVQIQYLPTFQRWDGAWRPLSALNRGTGEWPYVVEETSSEIRATRLGSSFTQAKVPDATYEFLPEGIKETFVIRLLPQDGIVSIPFTTAYAVDLRSDAISLRAADGSATWTTAPFHAWDSANQAKTWTRPISGLAYANGRLELTLDPNMLATATFPLYVDPTWSANPPFGWTGVTTTNATEDFGDQQMRIGWFSDNFNDGTKGNHWVSDGGSWWISGGAAQLNLSTRILSVFWYGSGKWDSKFQGKVTITATGSGTQLAKVIFRWTSSTNYHYVEIDEKNDRASLKKVVSGSPTTLCTGNPVGGIATGVGYVVKVDSQGGVHVVSWNGAVLCTATDPSPPPPGTNRIGFETSGSKMKIAVDDVRAWQTDIGSVTTDVRDAGSSYHVQAVRSVHAGGVYEWVDLSVLSSGDNVTWSGPHYAKAGAKSMTSGGYWVADPDRARYYQVRVDLRTTDDGSPALSEIATFEGGSETSGENSQVLGYESWQYYVGGMVNVVSGNLFLQATDLTLPGKGWSLAFTRAYNSLSTIDGPLGLGWTHAYNVLLTAGTDTVELTDGDGSTHVFENLGNGLYASPRGLGSVKLVRNGDLTYTMSSKDGSKWSFSSAGKLTQLADRNGNKVTLTYDGNGRLTKVADDSGIFLALAYDANGRVSRLTDLRSKDLSDGSTEESFGYGYDNTVNRESQTQTNGSQLVFAYEADYALNATQYEQGDRYAYTYDENGNRLYQNETHPGSPYSWSTRYVYNTDSSLNYSEQRRSDGMRTFWKYYTYDGNGNRVSDRFTDGVHSTTYEYRYDLENRLVSVLYLGSVEDASYAYFADGSRIRRSVPGTTTYFMYDFRDFNGFNDILEEYDASGNRVARYVHGPGIDEPFAMQRGGEWYYYHYDGLGSVTMLSRIDKSVANRYTYDDFGAFRAKWENVTNSYGYTSRETDVLGFVYYRARYYDSGVGRFLARDPAAMVDGPNVYAYAGNNPVSSVDPSGTYHAWWEFGIFCARRAGDVARSLQIQFGKRDKWAHCVWGCEMLRHCRISYGDATGLALLKEFQDLFGGGTTDIYDVYATQVGWLLCYAYPWNSGTSLCSRYYP